MIKARIAGLTWTLVIALVLSFPPPTSSAGEALPTSRDAIAAARAVRLADELRCLVCQNQTIAESNADLAVDLRQQIREQIATGKTDDDILAYMVARYGDFVLYRPPLRATTLLLWMGPLLLLLIGFIVLVRVLRMHRRQAPDPLLSPEERARAASLLAADADADAVEKTR